MTAPLYMHDAYLKEMEATIVDVTKETDSRWLVVLDKTIFYPRGGGNRLIKACFLLNPGKVK